MNGHRRPAVLVVDDDEDTREILLGALRPLAAAAGAADGQEALSRARELRPRLMLLDVVMPGMSGLEVLSAARELDPGMTVVMLTGDTDLDVARRALELGARSYITKPFDIAVVVEEVRRLVADPAERGETGGRPWRVAGERPPRSP